MKSSLFAILATIALTGCQKEQADETSPTAEDVIAVASIENSSGDDLGTVSLASESDGAVLILDLQDIEPGTKAFHLHTVGSCEAPDFTSAGGHLNPEGNSHGKLSEGGKHLGDLPNLEISDSGAIGMMVQIEGPSDKVLAAIQDDDGTSVMLHAGQDDYVSDPAGAAGPRIACGVLKPKS